MTNESVTREDLDSLRRYDTPTICNALEIVAPERRARGFTTECLICVDPTLPPICERRRNNPPLKWPVDPAAAVQNGTGIVSMVGNSASHPSHALDSPRPCALATVQATPPVGHRRVAA